MIFPHPIKKQLLLYFILSVFSFSSYGSKSRKCEEGFSNSQNQSLRSIVTDLGRALGKELKTKLHHLFRPPTDNKYTDNKYDDTQKSISSLLLIDQGIFNRDIINRDIINRDIKYLSESSKRSYERRYFEIAPSAYKGDSEAQRIFGIMHFHGIGVKQDYDQAFFWIKKSALQDNPHAQFNLSLMYYGGRGVRRSDADSADWANKAGKHYGGDHFALEAYDYEESIMDSMYILVGVERRKNDLEGDQRVFTSLRQLAFQGDPSAQYIMALIYYIKSFTQNNHFHSDLADTDKKNFHSYTWAFVAKHNNQEILRDLPISDAIAPARDYKEEITLLINDLEDLLTEDEIAEAQSSARQILTEMKE